MVGSLACSNMNVFNINEMIKTIGLTTKPLQNWDVKATETQKYKVWEHLF
jgi:hypothetical protein